VQNSARHYDPVQAGVAADLSLRLASPDAMLSTVDPLLAQPVVLDDLEFRALVTFVRDGLLDQRAQPQNLCLLVPSFVPSGMPMLDFQDCSAAASNTATTTAREEWCQQAALVHRGSIRVSTHRQNSQVTAPAEMKVRLKPA